MRVTQEMLSVLEKDVAKGYRHLTTDEELALIRICREALVQMEEMRYAAAVPGVSPQTRNLLLDFATRLDRAAGEEESRG